MDKLEQLLVLVKGLHDSMSALTEKVQSLDQRTRRVETMLERLPLLPRVSEALPERIEVEPCVPAHFLHNVDPEAEKLWESIRQQVKERIRPASYDTWFKPAVAYRIEGDTLLVWASNAFSADWLTSRYSDLVQSLLPDGPVKRVRFAWMDFVPDQD